MALEIFETGSEDYGQSIKALICGDAGAGKTLISSTFPNPFYASAEGGLMSVARRRVKGTNITATDQLRELRVELDQPPEVRAQRFGKPVDTIVVDTVDEVQKLFIKERLAAKRKDSMDMQDWGWLGDQMRLFLKAYRNLDMHVVFTCHLKESTDAVTGQLFVKPALQGAVGDEIPQYMDLALLLRAELATIVGQATERYERRYLQTYKDPQHTWIKDRSGQLPGEIAVNFDDDFDRISKAIYGFMTDDWVKEEARVVDSLATMVAETAPEPEPTPPTPEPTPEPVKEALEPEPEAPTEPEADTPGEAPKAEESLKEEAPSADTSTPPEGVDPETGEVVAPAADGFECVDCGDTFDSIDQKELGEIMLRRVVCGPCYRKATAK